MKLSPKLYNYKVALLVSLVGLTVSGQQAHSAGLFSKKPQPVHMNEVIKEVNSHGLSRLCSAGNAKSKLNRADFRYRQKGNKNHDEYLTAWVFCAYNSDGSPNMDFQNSTYGRTCQTILGGKKLHEALNDIKNAVKEERPARKIFCSLDVNKIPEGHVVKDVITYCHKLTAVGKQGVRGEMLTQDAELIPMEDETETLPTHSLKLEEKELASKKMPSKTVRLGEDELASKKMPSKTVRLGEDELAAKKMPSKTVRLGEDELASKKMPTKTVKLGEDELAAKKMPTKTARLGERELAAKKIPHTPVITSALRDLDDRRPMREDTFETPDRLQEALDSLDKPQGKSQTAPIPSVDEITYSPKIDQILRKKVKLSNMDIYDLGSEIIRFENLVNQIHGQNKPKLYVKHITKIQKLIKPVMDKIKPYLDDEAKKPGNFANWFKKQYPGGKPAIPSRENRPWPPKAPASQQPKPVYDMENYRGATFEELDSMEEPDPDAYEVKNYTADELLKQYSPLPTKRKITRNAD